MQQAEAAEAVAFVASVFHECVGPMCFAITFLQPVRCRSSGGAILAWRLHSSCAQISSEMILSEADSVKLRAVKLGSSRVHRVTSFIVSFIAPTVCFVIYKTTNKYTVSIFGAFLVPQPSQQLQW